MKLQDGHDPSFLTEYTVVNCTERSITVQWQEGGERVQQSRFYWKDRFHGTRQEATALASIWLEQEIEKRSRDVAKLKVILEQIASHQTGCGERERAP